MCSHNIANSERVLSSLPFGKTSSVSFLPPRPYLYVGVTWSIHELLQAVFQYTSKHLWALVTELDLFTWGFPVSFLFDGRIGEVHRKEVLIIALEKNHIRVSSSLCWWSEQDGEAEYLKQLQRLTPFVPVGTGRAAAVSNPLTLPPGTPSPSTMQSVSSYPPNASMPWVPKSHHHTSKNSEHFPLHLQVGIAEYRLAIVVLRSTIDFSVHFEYLKKKDEWGRNWTNGKSMGDGETSKLFIPSLIYLFGLPHLVRILLSFGLPQSASVSASSPVLSPSPPSGPS